MLKLKAIFPGFISSILFSYSQIFFSNNRIFALVLIAVSFLNPYAGISGLLAVITANLAAYLIGLKKENIAQGFYSFNALLVGLGLGAHYALGTESLVVIIFAALMSLFVSVLMEGIIGKYGLPYLTIPFMLVLWMVFLASRNYDMLHVSEYGIYTINNIASWGGEGLAKFYEFVNALKLHEAVFIYLKSLGAIFFQYNILAGILIAIGLLLYSRIAFLLSIIGFVAAYFFYNFIGANINELNYNYIGFNFILTAIAVGGFYFVSSKYSFLWVLLLTPLISILITSSSSFFNLFQLSIYSLPLNFIVLLFLYTMKLRYRNFLKPELVLFQRYSPENNLYYQKNSRERFNNYLYIPVSLPFYGEWMVSQGHDGAYTHQKDWRHAWDFVIHDNNSKSFKNDGLSRENYYCYGKPVLAPYDGWIETIISHIDDNEIGSINLNNNWGNTIIIKHAEGLFSKLSHLKKDSVKVKKGDYVQCGQLLALCGNSGNSPEPHLHFQLQQTPFIGSKTLFYPLGQYIQNQDNNYLLKSYHTPGQGDKISNINIHEGLVKAFNFVSGQQINIDVKSKGGNIKSLVWEVKYNILKQTYLYCSASNSKAYFSGNSGIFYFTHFDGQRESELFHFYKAAYKVPLGYYKGMEVHDKFPLNIYNNNTIKYLQDFVSPFFVFLRTGYQLSFKKMNDDFSSSLLIFESSCSVAAGRFPLEETKYECIISDNKIDKINISAKDKEIQLIWQGQ